jgi:hypothetical protein
LSDGRAGEGRAVDLPVPESGVTALAVSDGDDPLIAGILEDATVFVADTAGNFRSIAFAMPVSLTFLGGAGDLAVADGGPRAVWRLDTPLAGSAPALLHSEGLMGDRLRLASSADGRTLLILDSSRTVRVIDLRSGAATALECECPPVAPQALRGNSVFRLTEAVEQPVWIVDAGSGEPRLLFVPAISTEPER